MTTIGNHMKFNVHKSLRERVRSFYLDVLQCTTIPSPAPELEVKRRLIAFGVKEVEYPDKSRFYFQAPGGQVFRLAPEEGGI